MNPKVASLAHHGYFSGWTYLCQRFNDKDFWSPGFAVPNDGIFAAEHSIESLGAEDKDPLERPLEWRKSFSEGNVHKITSKIEQ
jgi:hypothetical protein